MKKQKFLYAALVLIAALIYGAIIPCAAMAADPAKPLVVWYSRSGTSQLVAESIQKYLGACDIDRIPSTKDRGFMTIVGEQYFGAADEQAKYPKSLAGYNPVFICAPVYFMKLSAPARAFMELNREELKGKDIYIFVTLGGKLAEDKKQAIKDFGSGLGLSIQAVNIMPTGKKEEFPGRIKEFFKNHPQIKPAQ